MSWYDGVAFRSIFGSEQLREFRRGHRAPTKLRADGPTGPLDADKCGLDGQGRNAGRGFFSILLIKSSIPEPIPSHATEGLSPVKRFKTRFIQP